MAYVGGRLAERTHEQWQREREQHEAITYPYGQAEARFRSGAKHPVVGLDIDGTLGDYHGHFLAFAEGWFGRPMPHPDEINPGLPLSTFMGVPHDEYRDCKLAYRQGGQKRTMPVYPFAMQLAHNIRTTGTQVWLCTTRPYQRLDNVDPDTREWLRRNDIEYDAVIWEGIDEGPDATKYYDLVDQVGLNRIVAVADDLPEQTADAYRQGIGTVYLRDAPYNRGREVPGLRVTSLEDLWEAIAADIALWKDEHIA